MIFILPKRLPTILPMENKSKERPFIDRLAALAHLSFEGEEKEQMAADMEGIMKLMDTIAKMDFSDAMDPVPADGGMELLREDIIEASRPAEKLLSNAKEKSHPYFAVPKMMD